VTELTGPDFLKFESIEPADIESLVASADELDADLLHLNSDMSPNGEDRPDTQPEINQNSTRRYFL